MLQLLITYLEQNVYIYTVVAIYQSWLVKRLVDSGFLNASKIINEAVDKYLDLELN